MTDRVAVHARPGVHARLGAFVLERFPFAAAAVTAALATLPPIGAPIEAPDAASFDAAIAAANLPIVVDFWAPWCGPCHAVAPELEKVARGAAGKYLIVKVDTDAVPELGERFRIRSIPTMAVFAGGREVGRTSGARPAPDIEAFIQSTLGRR